MTPTSASQSDRRWLVAIHGARDYYSGARYLHSAGRLERLYTDLWIPPTSANLLGRLAPSTEGRWHPELAKADVRSDNIRSILQRLRKRGTRYEGWLIDGSRVASRTVRGMIGQDTHELGLFGYTGGTLEMMDFARREGIPGVHAQVDPGIAWYQCRDEALAEWPGAEDASEAPDPRYLDRIRAELDSASCIIVNSKHSAASLISQGVDGSKITIVPLATRAAAAHVSLDRSDRRDRPFRVLFVGSVTIAKGYPYFGEAAKLVGSAAEFVAAGSMVLRQEFLAQHHWPVRSTGHLSRSMLADLMANSDVLVFPTLSDGFGLVQLEAMAAGLPVIATRFCGDVVEDGVSGFLIPARDAQAIASAVMTLRDDPVRYAEMSAAAIRRVADFAPDVVAPQFIAALDAARSGATC